MNVVVLGFWQLLAAGALVLAAGVLDLVLRLGLQRTLWIATLRAVVQLFAVGLVLEGLFRLDDPRLLLPVLGIMVLAAAREAAARGKRRLRGGFWVAFTGLGLTAIPITFYLTLVVIQPQPWWTARYVIPLLGMVLGNAMNGISLSVDTLLEALQGRAEAIEAELALGATRWEAGLPSLREALRRGMIPTINMLSVVGLVSLPGMMTGQILEGGSPWMAVRYQLVILFAVAGAAALGSALACWLVLRTAFNGRHQLVRGVISG